MFNIQNISYRNLFCILNIYVINKPKMKRNVLYSEQFYVNMFNVLNISRIFAIIFLAKH